jgi:hypothetical protein
MTQSNSRIALVLTGVLVTVLTTTLDLQSASAEGAARRDAVRQEQVVKDALQHATEAVEHGKQGHAEKLVTHAEASLLQTMRGGTDPHSAEAITNLKQAIEHAKAGHADVATKHAESAVTHLSQIK